MWHVHGGARGARAATLTLTLNLLQESTAAGTSFSCLSNPQLLTAVAMHPPAGDAGRDCALLERHRQVPARP